MSARVGSTAGVDVRLDAAVERLGPRRRPGRWCAGPARSGPTTPDRSRSRPGTALTTSIDAEIRPASVRLSLAVATAATTADRTHEQQGQADRALGLGVAAAGPDQLALVVDHCRRQRPLDSAAWLARRSLASIAHRTDHPSPTATAAAAYGSPAWPDSAPIDRTQARATRGAAEEDMMGSVDTPAGQGRARVRRAEHRREQSSPRPGRRRPRPRCPRASGASGRRTRWPRCRSRAGSSTTVWQPPAEDPAVTESLLWPIVHVGNYCAIGVRRGQQAASRSGSASASSGSSRRTSLHSHAAGVTGAGAGRNLGFALKQDQRAWALDRGLGDGDLDLRPAGAAQRVLQRRPGSARGRSTTWSTSTAR